MNDFVAYLMNQISFSRATFGPEERMEGILDHISKEIEEVRKAERPEEEWVDLVILSLDGLIRSLDITRETQDVAWDSYLCIREKLQENELRDWPDWRTADPNKAIEHIREGEE